MKTVAVYTGHQMGTDPAFARDAAKVGELLARNKIRLVWGGGNVGLMGVVAGAVIKNGGEAIGVSTHHVIARQEPVLEGATKVEIVDGINERKQRMFELSDAFCILPGGLGTLNELTDILTMQQVGESKKPVYFLNTHKYWNSFSRIFVHMQQNGFIANIRDYHIRAAMTPEELLQLIMKHE